jgi:hypothetical protein
MESFECRSKTPQVTLLSLNNTKRNRDGNKHPQPEQDSNTQTLKRVVELEGRFTPVCYELCILGNTDQTAVNAHNQG